jgi:hypothetical protein
MWMMKKVDVSSYLQPGSRRDESHVASESEALTRPKHDPTYSALFGYGFNGAPKLLRPHAPPVDNAKPE